VTQIELGLDEWLPAYSVIIHSVYTWCIQFLFCCPFSKITTTPLTTCAFGLKQTGHPWSEHWREVSANSAELWSRHWNGVPHLCEAEAGPTHWQRYASGGRKDHVGSAAVQPNSCSHGSLSTGFNKFMAFYCFAPAYFCFILLFYLFYSQVYCVDLLTYRCHSISFYSLTATRRSFHTWGQEDYQEF